MSKSGAKIFLGAYFFVFFGAVFARVDYFPLSWVPMYGARQTEPVLTVPVGDLRQRGLGFRVVRANGDVDYVSRHDLNMPPANFRRLYTERAFGEGPPQHHRERLSLSPPNRWWYDHLVGPDPLHTANYERQILVSMNKTFGLRPGDPDYIVQIAARSLFAGYSLEDRERGDLSKPILEEWMSTTTMSNTRIERRPVDASE